MSIIFLFEGHRKRRFFSVFYEGHVYHFSMGVSIIYDMVQAQVISYLVLSFRTLTRHVDYVFLGRYILSIVARLDQISSWKYRQLVVTLQMCYYQIDSIRFDLMSVNHYLCIFIFIFLHLLIKIGGYHVKSFG